MAIVGVIRDAQESATSIMYTINDMTGEDLIVRKWLDNEVGFEVMLPLFVECTCTCTCTWKSPLYSKYFFLLILCCFPHFLAK